MKTLYSFVDNGTVKYGTHIGTNSSNQLLIEEKGSGRIYTLNRNDVDEVVPYTFSVVDVMDDLSTTHYIGTPDTVKKGDILLTAKGDLVKVVAVNTKSKTASTTFKGRRVVTEEI